MSQILNKTQLADAFSSMLKKSELSDSKLGFQNVPESKTAGKSFADYISDSLSEINENQKQTDKMATNIATGKTENIHETMLAITQAELSFNLMVQVRNKALEAYQEVMRMPV